MNDKEYNRYMTKFKDEHFIKRDTDHVHIIKSKLGKIGPYHPKNQLLGVWCINLTPWKKTSLLKQLFPYLTEVHQNCETEFGAYFHEKHLDAVCKIIKARKKRQLTHEQREKLAYQAKMNFNLKK